MDEAGVLFVAVAALVFAVPFAGRIGVPFPVLLTVVGIGAALIPGFPAISISPDLILPVLLPPLLYAAAQRTSWAQMRAQWRPIIALAVALVAASAFAVAFTLTALVPGIPWALAFALGAAVAPPDPVAATSVAGGIGLPHRIVAVIEGEGLVNDATALTLYHSALAAAAIGGTISWYAASSEFLLGTAGGIGVGLVLTWLTAKVLNRLTDPALQGAFTIALPYAAYLAAEAFGVSGVLAVLVVGLGARGMAYRVLEPEGRLMGRAFWETADLLLTALAFVVIGLELRPILRGAGSDIGRDFLVGLAICGVLMGLRMLWLVLAGLTAARKVAARRPTSRAGPVPANWREGVVMGWAGMRGVVTIAAALGPPAGVPHRETMLVVAFVVVAVTLVLPGLTLPLVARWTGVGGVDRAAAIRDVSAKVIGAVMLRVDEMYSDGSLDSDGASRWRTRCGRLMVALNPGSGQDPELAERHAAMRVTAEVNSQLLAAAQEEALRLRLDHLTDPAAVDHVLHELDRRLF